MKTTVLQLSDEIIKKKPLFLAFPKKIKDFFFKII